MPVKQDTNIENKESTTPTLGVLGTNHQFWSKKKKAEKQSQEAKYKEKQNWELRPKVKHKTVFSPLKTRMTPSYCSLDTY